MENGVKERQSNFELLRIFAMLMIVAYHYFCHGIRHVLNPDMAMLWQDGLAFNKLFTSLFMSGGNIGNGIFFMLTGYFLYSKKYEIRRITKLLLQVYFYAIFLFLLWGIIRFFHIYNFSEVKPISQMMFLINVFIPITSGGWWFIQTYIVLFLFIPILNNFLSKLSLKFFLGSLIFVYIFWFIPSIFHFGYSNLQMAIFYYVLGAILKKSDFTINKWASICLFFVVVLILFILDMKDSQIIKSENISEMFLKVIYRSFKDVVFTPIAVVFIFEFCKGLNIGNRNSINKIASTTFGIYLIHDSTISRDFIWNKIFHCLDIQYKSQYFPLISIGSILCVFFVCSVVDYFRQIFIEKETIKFFDKKIDYLFEKLKKA